MRSGRSTAVLACVAVGVWAVSMQIKSEPDESSQEVNVTLSPSRSPSARGPASEEATPKRVVASESPNEAEPSSANSPQPLSGAWARLKGFQECVRTQACDYAQDDPKSYDFAVHREWTDFLRSLKGEVGRDSRTDAVLAELARESMNAHDGHVQEAALELLAALPEDPRNLEAVVRGLEVNDSDPLILSQASAEMKRYLGTPAEELVHGFLERTLRSGAHFTAEQAGVVAKEFIHEASIERYRRLLQEIPPETAKARNLRAAVSDFELRRSGG